MFKCDIEHEGPVYFFPENGLEPFTRSLRQKDPAATKNKPNLGLSIDE